MPGLNHVSFELRGVEEYLRGTGRLIRAGYRPLWGPGRHSPGDNTYAYFADPLRRRPRRRRIVDAAAHVRTAQRSALKRHGH